MEIPDSMGHENGDVKRDPLRFARAASRFDKLASESDADGSW